jgi:hypothetical protein
MSRSLSPARLLSTATISAMLLGTACSDSTAPSTEHAPSAAAPAERPASPGGDTPSESQDTSTSGLTPVKPTISAVVRTFDWVKYPFSLPGIAAPSSRSAFCANIMGYRHVSFAGVQVTNLDYQQGRQAMLVQIQLSRYNAALNRWDNVAVRNWQVPYTQFVTRQWMSVPAVDFSPLSAGYYSVTVQASWYVWDVLHAQRRLALNSATDFDPSFGIVGQSVSGIGYCYIP